jgi:hypothetical protein
MHGHLPMTPSWPLKSPKHPKKQSQGFRLLELGFFGFFEEGALLNG